MVWLTSENPCLAATSRRPLPRPRGRPPRWWNRSHGTPDGGDGAPSTCGRPTHRCRCAACRPFPPRPSTAASGRRWSGRCSRRGGAARRAVPGPSGTRRASPAVWKSPPAGGWTARRPSLAPVSRRVLARVGDRVDDDVREVVVGEPVQHFAAGSLPGDHARRLEDLQMLADQRLWHARGRRPVRARSAAIRAIAARWRSARARPARAAVRRRRRESPAAAGRGIREPNVTGPAPPCSWARPRSDGQPFHLRHRRPSALRKTSPWRESSPREVPDSGIPPLERAIGCPPLSHA